MTHRGPSAPERLLTAALTEFARHGKAGARTQRIAQRAGVNKQLISYYFGSKDALYRATLERAGQGVARALARELEPAVTAVERLRRLLRIQFDYLATHEEPTSLLLHSGHRGAWFDAAAQPLVAVLTEGQATGFFRDDLDPLLLARQVLVLHLGYFALGSLTSGWGPASAWRDQMAEVLVQGCSW